MIDQRRRLRSFGTRLDVVPQAFQEANVGAQFLFTRVLRGGADDETSVAVVALAHHDALQALAFFVRCDLARNSSVVHRRHVDQKAPRQRDVAGDARAFLADRLLGNLHQNFLAFFQQVADLRNFVRLAAREAASTTVRGVRRRWRSKPGRGRGARCV